MYRRNDSEHYVYVIWRELFIRLNNKKKSISYIYTNEIRLAGDVGKQ